ncbi:MAG TPA: hypothetical protein VG734_17690 [Lacunisphaera sp.]|nr:hypothetical protein [Lacunisphaera sp.]
MHSRCAALLLTLGIFRLAGTVAQGGEFHFFPNIWGNVIVNTDMTPAGRALMPPHPDRPVYYRGRSLGNRLGTYTMPGERLPDVKETNDFIAKVLARQGYLPARQGQDPDLFLIVQWGYLNSGYTLGWFLGYDPVQDPAGTPGWEHLRVFRSKTMEAIVDAKDGPIYGVIVSAFEYRTVRTPHPVIYWQTRIGLPANGKSMATAVPTMILAAGPSIGLETKSAVLRDADAARSGRVEMGELKYLGFTPAPGNFPSRPNTPK